MIGRAFRNLFLGGRRGVPTAAGELPLKKVAWLNPLELLRTGYHTWLVTAGSGLIDRREMLAALDHGEYIPIDEYQPDTRYRTQESWRTKTDLLPCIVARGQHIDGFISPPPGKATDGLWVDFVADVGDSWEATYATASLIADPNLCTNIPLTLPDGQPTTSPPAQVVVLGGDLVYPRATRDAYRRRLRAPFTAARPRTTEPPGPAMFAIPGNHDWYDGLTDFVREFCQGGFLGAWQLTQRRSYFAVRLIRGWWLWGIDIALDTRIDAPQQKYFLDIVRNEDPSVTPAEQFQKGDRIILCTAKPAWLEISRYSDEAYRNLVNFIDGVAKEGGDVPVILTGDLHHYSRYSHPKCELIGAGGGGAYLMGTHFLPERIAELKQKPSLAGDEPPKRRKKSRSMGDDTAAASDAPKRGAAPGPFVASASTYPSRSDSRRLALGALLLAFRPANWSFALLVGLVYWFLTPAIRDHQAGLYGASGFVSLPGQLWLHPELLNLVLVFVVAAGCVAFAVGANQRASRYLTTLWGIAHAALQIWLAASIGLLFARPSGVLLSGVQQYLHTILFFVVAGLAGATLLGVYIVVSDRFFDLHHNEAFAVQSLIDYRNFVRMYIGKDQSLTIFPIGLRRVPRRWRRRVDRKVTEPFYEPADDTLKPHLIEGPIRIPPKAQDGGKGEPVDSIPNPADTLDSKESRAFALPVFLLLGGALLAVAGAVLLFSVWAGEGERRFANCPYTTTDYTLAANDHYDFSYFPRDGRAFAYHDFGGTDKPLAVLVAGMPQAHYLDATAMQLYQKGYRVLILDLPGKNNTKLTGPPTAASIAAQFDKLAASLGLDQKQGAVIVGTSFAAPVAAALATRWASRQPKLALISPLGMPREWPFMVRLGGVPVLSTALAPFLLPVQVRRNWKNGEILCPEQFPQLFKRQQAEFDRVAATCSYLELGKALVLADQTPVYRELADTAVPVLIANGDRDPFSDQRTKLQALIPRAQTETIANAAHLTFIEQPGATFVLIDRFAR
jgi:alpha-beta hydrolase superfamily lysophospholipase